MENSTEKNGNSTFFRHQTYLKNALKVIISFLNKTVEGTLEMRKNRKLLENENCYCGIKKKSGKHWFLL